MKVRSVDFNNDWEFGKGKSNYKSAVNACAQNIKTRLQSFLGDCFFSTDSGLDWFKFMGGKNMIELKLAVAATILKTPDVVSIEEVSTSRDNDRAITIKYSVQTVYGRINQSITQEV